MTQDTSIQLNEILEFCETRDWTNYEIFEDKISGATDDRPQLNEMMNKIRQGKFNTLISWKLDRVFRSLSSMVMLLRSLDELNVDFISIKDNFDASTHQGRLYINIVSAFAEFERELIRERVKASLDNLKRQGVQLGRPTSINHDEVIRLHEKGLSMGAISKHLGVAKSSIHRIIHKVRNTPKGE